MGADHLLFFFFPSVSFTAETECPGMFPSRASSDGTECNQPIAWDYQEHSPMDQMPPLQNQDLGLTEAGSRRPPPPPPLHLFNGISRQLNPTQLCLIPPMSSTFCTWCAIHKLMKSEPAHISQKQADHRWCQILHVCRHESQQDVEFLSLVKFTHQTFAPSLLYLSKITLPAFGLHPKCLANCHRSISLAGRARFARQ